VLDSKSPPKNWNRLVLLFSDLINEIIKMQQNNKDSVDNLNSNPVAALITSEWFYSDSSNIFPELNYSWDNLQNNELVQTVASNIDKIPSGRSTDREEFEASFCSWYQSYHYAPRTKWGIHIRRQGWIRVAAHFCRMCPSLKSDRVSSSAAAFLYLIIHNLFHYLTENAASLMEIISKNLSLYKYYVRTIYSDNFNTHNCLEESLANSYLFQSHKKCHIDRDFLRKELLMQGPGYGDFTRYLDSNFIVGCRRLMSHILHGNSGTQEELPLEQMLGLRKYEHIDYDYCIPVWLHDKPTPLH
jgi:hypothetical protein